MLIKLKLNQEKLKGIHSKISLGIERREMRWDEGNRGGEVTEGKPNIENSLKSIEIEVMNVWSWRILMDIVKLRGILCPAYVNLFIS